MARIRTIKPELWSQEAFGECSPSARLLLLAAKNFADDNGNLDRSAKQLKAQCLPYDQTEPEPLVAELLRAGLFIEYEVAGKLYLHIKDFETEQRIDRPGRTLRPLYDDSATIRGQLAADSARAPRGLVEDSSNARRALDPVRKEGNVLEGREGDAPPLPAAEMEQQIAAHVQAIKSRYPPVSGRIDWITAEKSARNLVLNGQAAWPELIAGVDRYRKWCDATGSYVLNPAKFFGDRDRPWSQRWNVPPGKGDARAPAVRNDEAAWAELRARAKAISFEEPWPNESIGSYTTRIKLAEDRVPPSAVRERIAGAVASLKAVK